MPHEHSHSHSHRPAAPALSVLSSGIALRLGVAGLAGAALWLTIWWALA
ncbi:MAG: hypothetical protein LPJ91_09645 [Pseudazoarcus pumilus]|nr:hypothetical protein [Pseudazoarcus pumilus]